MRWIVLMLFLPMVLVAQKAPKKPQVAQEVKADFQKAWMAYKKHAWKKDALSPLSKSSYNVYYQPFYLTALEGYSSLKLLGFDEEAEETKAFLLRSLAFKKFTYVPVGEFGSRVVSSLLAAYQLDGDTRFVELAVDIANRLLPAFDSPTGMPHRLISLGSRKTKENNNTPNQIGTLLVEFGLLSQITGNPLYYNTAKKAALALWEKRSDKGLLGSSIDVTTGDWVAKDSNTAISVTGYYAAVLKAFLLLGDNDLLEIWNKGTEAISNELAYEAGAGVAYKYSKLDEPTQNDSILKASEALYPGLLALGGKLEEAEKNYSYYKAAVGELVLPADLKNLKKDKLIRTQNRLAPAFFQSIYLLYDGTKKTVYAEDAERIYRFMQTHCRTNDGFVGLRDVGKKTKLDKMPPHVLSQNLKYLYLIFAEHNWPVGQLVFSANGQPLQAVK